MEEHSSFLLSRGRLQDPSGTSAALAAQKIVGVVRRRQIDICIDLSGSRSIPFRQLSNDAINHFRICFGWYGCQEFTTVRFATHRKHGDEACVVLSGSDARRGVCDVLVLTLGWGPWTGAEAQAEPRAEPKVSHNLMLCAKLSFLSLGWALSNPLGCRLHFLLSSLRNTNTGNEGTIVCVPCPSLLA